MGFVLGAGSRAKLDGVHPDLVRVVERAIEITRHDFSVLCGVRTKAEQAALYAQGRTKPGPVVTWTMDSRHIPQADGYGHAVDLVPYPMDWKSGEKFDAIAAAMFKASSECGVPLRWGQDWNRNGVPRERGETDAPHFELAGF